MRFFLNVIFLNCVCGVLTAQPVTQTVKGKISDEVNGMVLLEATVQIFNQVENFTAQSDASGNFSLQVPVGRYKIRTYLTGYKSVEQELLVISGRESVLNISLPPAVETLQAVEVTGTALGNDAPGLLSLSIEKTLRVPANFFDPVRVVTAYPGVVAANDQANSIIIRGNSPNGLLWRLNGLDIVNPNHLANAGTLSDVPMANGGGVNILSAQMLDRTEFYTGAFPATYGNSVSGIIDMKLRDGNKSKMEYTAQASLIGLDLSAEGPLGKNQRSAYLANYRYSTVGLLSALGVNFGDEAISFQDFSFNSGVEGKKGQHFSVFGFWGQSKNDFEAKDPDEWEVDKDKYSIFYDSRSFAVGTTYKVPFAGGKFTAGLSYSVDEHSRSSDASPLVQPDTRIVLNDSYNSSNGIVSSALGFETKTGASSTLEVGIMTNLLRNTVDFDRAAGCLTCGFTDYRQLRGSIAGILFQPYAHFNAALSTATNVNAGIRYLNFSFNDIPGAIEPRVGLSVKPNAASGFDIAYSLVSQLPSPMLNAQPGNEELGMTRSHHGDLSYRHTFAGDLNIKTGAFYQHLFDVPIENFVNSTFSAINQLEGFAPPDLVNEGTGDNYGADLTLEKFFYSKNYFLFGGSYYESKYTPGDGIKRNSRFNGNYTLSGIYGKEWIKAEKSRTTGLNLRVLYLGGLRQSAIDVTNSQTTSETVFDDTDPFNQKLPDYFRLDLRLSFRKNKPGYTRTFAIDIQNLTSQQNEAFSYYDFTQGKIITKYQLGIIPILVYRIDF